MHSKSGDNYMRNLKSKDDPRYPSSTQNSLTNSIKLVKSNKKKFQ